MEMCEKAPISDTEWLVMQVVWRRSPITATEVIEELAPRTTWKPKTVMTLLNRLVKKGNLAFHKKGRAYHYYPLRDQAHCVRAESRSFVQRVYGGALKPMLASFLEDADLSREDVEELKRILDRRANDAGKS
jgi:BlaI family transcriptional regulator, penicillinase repressor